MEKENKKQENPKKQQREKVYKKLSKAVMSIVFHESKETDKLFIQRNKVEVLTHLKFFVYHHGNGDESDSNLLNQLMNGNNVGNAKINIFPGISYGYIEFASADCAQKFSQSCELIEMKDVTTVMNFVYKYINNNHQIHNKKNENSAHDNNSKAPQVQEKERPIFLFPTLLSLDEIKLYSQSSVHIAKYSQTEDYCVPGLVIIDNLITEDEENKLVEAIEKKEWVKLSNRQVQHYGYEFIYGKNTIDKYSKIGELPDFCINVCDRLRIELGNFHINDEQTQKANAEFYDYDNSKTAVSFVEKHGEFDQLTINKYSPGDGIPPHVDSHSPFNDIYCSISLISGTVLTLTKGCLTRSFYIKPRSAVFFTNELRYEWEHSIALRKVDLVDGNIVSRSKRISLTFRRIRKENECNCIFNKQCDTFKQKSNLSSGIIIKDELLNSEVPTDIEKKHVYAVYDLIAPHFSHTRYKPWPQVVDYLKSLEKYSIVGDIGCGNGKYLSVVEGLITLGTDRSSNLSKIAYEKNPKSNLFVADSLTLPIRTGSLDAAISIAVIHHFSNDLMRIRALKEIVRCVKRGGTFLVYVWALEQENGKFKEQDNLVPWHLQDSYKEDSSIKEQPVSNAFDTSSTTGYTIKEKQSTVFHRYYHVFKQGELENLIYQLEGVSILKSYYDHENWCCICQTS